jgi:hypothetical protein
MSEHARNARLVAIRQNIAANRRRAELVRWQEQRERIMAVNPRCEAERQAQWQALALLEQSRPD